MSFASRPPKLDADALLAFVAQVFPRAIDLGFVIDHVEAGRVRLALDAGEAHIRPGGTVSGPTMMTLADTAMWFATLAAIGPVALAVTTDLSIHFLRRPAPGRMYAEGRLLKLGKRLAVGEVRLWTEAAPDDLVAHSTVSYSIPPPEAR